MASEIGLIGLAVMGQNLSLNIASKGFRISVWNRTYAKVEDTVKRAMEEKLQDRLKGCKTMEEFVISLTVPRKIILLIQAGPAVDAALSLLQPLLSAGDLVIDGGNEWYENTDRRAKQFEQAQIRYLGMGVSGGEEGARHGPALMPGGSYEGFQAVEAILVKIAAQVEDGPCVSYIGKEGSGNYVKMVHNGIEYADMQIIAEAYELLKLVGRFSNADLATVFREWNKTELQSYLIEITSEIFDKKDDLLPTGSLVDKILDVAGAKGTGKWTIQEAATRGVPVPTIEAAVGMRNMSQLKTDREMAAKHFHSKDMVKEAVKELDVNVALKDIVREALYCAKVCCYAQGFMLLKNMSEEKEWKLKLGEIARTWKGGCIIRAKFLDRIREAYSRQHDLPSLLLDPHFGGQLVITVKSLRLLTGIAIKAGIPVPAMAASLAYFDAYRTPTLPVNLIQAQRDYFGAHTYQRVDREGIYHTDWTT